MWKMSIKYRQIKVNKSDGTCNLWRKPSPPSVPPIPFKLIFSSPLVIHTVSILLYPFTVYSICVHALLLFLSFLTGLHLDASVLISSVLFSDLTPLYPSQLGQTLEIIVTRPKGLPCSFYLLPLKSILSHAAWQRTTVLISNLFLTIIKIFALKTLSGWGWI